MSLCVGPVNLGELRVVWRRLDRNDPTATAAAFAAADTISTDSATALAQSQRLDLLGWRLSTLDLGSMGGLTAVDAVDAD